MRNRYAHAIVMSMLLGGVFIFASFSPASEEGLCDSPLVGGHTGAPGESSCTGCHGGTANTGSAVIEWNVGDAGTYVPGTSYTGTVKIKRLGREKFGFVCLALQDAGNVNLGGFGLLEAVRTRTYVDDARNYVSHTPCGADAQDSTEWSFTWQAPATDVGPITIYMANLVANHSHNTTGDETYTRTITLSPAVGIAEQSAALPLTLYPDPATDHLILSAPLAIARGTAIEVFDAAGHQVMRRSLGARPLLQEHLDISTLAPGMYSLILRSGERTGAQRFVKE